MALLWLQEVAATLSRLVKPVAPSERPQGLGREAAVDSAGSQRMQHKPCWLNGHSEPLFLSFVSHALS